MSIKVINRVWTDSTVGGSQLLILLAIADHAHDDGGGAYPSINTLAKKCKISPRQTQRIITLLEDAKEIAIDRGAGPKGTNVFTVLTGLQGNKSTKCYMCERINDGEVEFDKHHRIPGDDDSIVDICKPCHIRLHRLIGYKSEGGDKLSPVTDGSEGVTNLPLDPDITVSPEPSLTVTEPSINLYTPKNEIKKNGTKTPPSNGVPKPPLSKQFVIIYGEQTSQRVLPAHRKTIEKLALSPGATLARWQATLEDCVLSWSGNGSPPLERIIAVYTSGLTYREFIKQTYNGNSNGNGAKNDNGHKPSGQKQPTKRSKYADVI